MEIKTKVLQVITKLKLNSAKYLPFLLTVFFSSCISSYEFEYDNKKEIYQDAVGCLHQNYFKIFNTSKLENSISLYKQNFIGDSTCSNIFKLMVEQSIEFVNYYKDSTIAFYANSNRGIRKKQHILMFSNERRKVIEKLSSEIKIIRENSDGCYELERVISLAN